jgi:hypothetical protein
MYWRHFALNISIPTETATFGTFPYFLTVDYISPRVVTPLSLPLSLSLSLYSIHSHPDILLDCIIHPQFKYLIQLATSSLPITPAHTSPPVGCRPIWTPGAARTHPPWRALYIPVMIQRPGHPARELVSGASALVAPRRRGMKRMVVSCSRITSLFRTREVRYKLGPDVACVLQSTVLPTTIQPIDRPSRLAPPHDRPESH